MTDIDEQQPDAVLKGAEYVEYLGLYFNREKEASAAGAGAAAAAEGDAAPQEEVHGHGQK